MRIHLIAIGGGVMHNLAISLLKKGYQVTGSDDIIFEPAKSQLRKYHLLPSAEGWNVDLIHADLDAVILGMHALVDNPELLKAHALGLPIYSYPEYIYEQSKDKIRVVIGGSHGKTTITSMIMHVLKHHGTNFDYLVGAQLKGFDTMVKITEDAPLIVIEGDEYLASSIDRRPKFHLYKPNIAVLSGIAWDHINVFTTFENYLKQFVEFLKVIEHAGTLIYLHDDLELRKMTDLVRDDIIKIAYSIPKHIIKSGITYLLIDEQDIPLEIFGDHNLLNLNAAKAVCLALGLTKEDFYLGIQSFRGASKRLELLGKNENTVVFRDFAHAPSKVRASVQAIRTRYPEKKLIAVVELHTFSSLNETFLRQYTNTINGADEIIVFCDDHILAKKGIKKIALSVIKNCFNNSKLQYINSDKELVNSLLNKNYKNTVLLLMGSGNFGNIDLLELKNKILSKY